MTRTLIRPAAIFLAALILLMMFTLEMVLSSPAAAEPYPRHDHYNMSEDKRQYPNRRHDDYEDYYKRRMERTDHYRDYVRPTLSQLDPTPEGTMSLERVKTVRSQFTDNLRPDEDKEYGRGYYDERDNKGIDVLEGGKGYY